MTAIPKRQRVAVLALAIIVLVGLAVRLLDLTEPPLDYHPSRQLRGAIIARGIYYQWMPSADAATREQAVGLKDAQGVGEPPIFETLVALSYLAAGGEHLWFARLWSLFFWFSGGIALFVAARRLTDTKGAIAALAYYLILPFGVYASRSFQPDILMVMTLCVAIAVSLRWAEQRSMSWALAAGLSSGLATLIKGQQAPLVAGLILGTVAVSEKDLFKIARNLQVWTYGGVAVAVPAVYYLGPFGPHTAGMLSEYSFSVVGLLRDPSFYARWAIFIDGLVYLGFALLGIAAIPFLPRQGRGLLVGLWVGYVAYGLLFPYMIYTHDYYSVALIPIVALSLAPVGSLLVAQVSKLSVRWRVFVAGVAMVSIAYPSWLARSGILGTDYHSESAGWIKMGRELPKGASIIALTHDYGARVAYYGWRQVGLWPTSADFKFSALQGHNQAENFERQFETRTRGYDYFLVTLFSELKNQPELEEKLYRDFSIAIDGNGYLLFDLSP